MSQDKHGSHAMEIEQDIHKKTLRLTDKDDNTDRRVKKRNYA